MKKSWFERIYFLAIVIVLADGILYWFARIPAGSIIPKPVLVFIDTLLVCIYTLLFVTSYICWLKIRDSVRMLEGKK
jgi:hypothetical protein